MAAAETHKHASVLLPVSLVSSPILVAAAAGAPLAWDYSISTGMDSLVACLLCLLLVHYYRFRVHFLQRKKNKLKA